MSKVSQQRKKQAEKKRRQNRRDRSLAYNGQKYKTDQLVPVWHAIESTIYEFYLATERKLTDHQVALAVESVIRKIRTHTLPACDESKEIVSRAGEEHLVLIELIALVLKDPEGAKSPWRPSTDQVIGVLRSILGTIDLVGTPGQAQAYLKHVGKYNGHNVAHTIDGDNLHEVAIDVVDCAHAWLQHGDRDARAEFLEFAEQIIEQGTTGNLIGLCEMLSSEFATSPIDAAELRDLIQRARKVYASSS